MRIDLYTKAVLTVIALLLAVVACKDVSQPPGVAASGPLAGVQFSATLGGLFAIDTNTGEMWMYGEDNKAKYAGKITKLGDPIDVTPLKGK